MTSSLKKDCISEIGTLLIQGWTMLSSSCPDCKVPLMQNRKGGQSEMFCVNCQRDLSVRNNKEEEDGGDEEEEEEEEQIQEPRRVNQNQAETRLAPGQGQLLEMSTVGQKKRDGVSDNIGAKLLGGWTLLGESCPACYVPLMRNKQGEMWCVNCNVMVVMSGDFDPIKHRPLNPENLDEGQVPGLEQIPTQSTTKESLLSKSATRKETPCKQTAPQEERHAPPPPPTSSSSFSSSSAIGVLESKIETFSAELRNESSLKRCAALSEAIASAAKAIKHLRNIE